jgi:hypothetical protein
VALNARTGGKRGVIDLDDRQHSQAAIDIADDTDGIFAPAQKLLNDDVADAIPLLQPIDRGLERLPVVGDRPAIDSEASVRPRRLDQERIVERSRDGVVAREADFARHRNVQRLRKPPHRRFVVAQRKA